MTRPERRRRLRSRRPLAAAAVLCLLVVGAAPADGFWAATSSGPYARAQASSLTAPGLSTGTATPTTVPLTWTQPFAPTGYALGQSPGSLAGCAASPSSGSTSCTATGLTPNTSYTWSLGAGLHNWVATGTATATTSKQATTTTLGNITPTTAVAGSTFGATATVTGNSGFGTPAGTVVFSLYPTPDCSGAASLVTAAQTVSGGSATGSLQPTVGTYYWRAVYTPTDTFNLASTSACSAAITVTAGGGTFAAISPAVTVGSSTVNVPVSYPAGTASGDLLLLVVVNGASQNSTIGSAGWTLIAKPNLGGSKLEMQAWWHRAGAETSVTLSQFQTNGSGASAWVLDYKNIANPTMVGVSSGANGSAASLTPANVSTTGTDATVISLVGIKASAALTVTNARGFATRANPTVSTPPPGRSLGVADRFVAAAGSVTPPTWTEGATSSQWAYITVAFR